MKQLIPIITELFTRGRKADISLDCITQSYFAVLRFQKIVFNHSSDFDCKDFLSLYKNMLQNHIL